MAKCKGCGKEIVWGETPDGKKIPLDPKPPIYSVITLTSGITVATRGPKNQMVSHFATCSEANQFSGKNKGA